MLVRPAGFTKPGVVGDVDQQDGVVFCHCPGEPGENDFVTDLYSQSTFFPGQGLAGFSGTKITHLGDNLT